MTRVIPIILFVVFAAIASILLLHKKPADSHRSAYALPTLDIGAMNDAKRRFTPDDTTMVLNFFASWCAPCLEEHKELLLLKQQFPNVRFHGIIWNDSPANIRDMLRKHGNPYDSIWIDDAGKAAIALGLRGVPESFIVKRGQIVYHLSGPITANIRTTEIEDVLAR